MRARERTANRKSAAQPSVRSRQQHDKAAVTTKVEELKTKFHGSQKNHGCRELTAAYARRARRAPVAYAGPAVKRTRNG